MKTLQLISSGGVYGAETMLLALAKALTSLGHETVLGVFRNAHRLHTEIAERAALQRLPVELIPCSGRADRNAVRAIRDCIRIHAIDIVHTHGYKANLYGYAATGRGRTPLVGTCHNWTDETVPLRLYRYLDCLVLRRFARIAAVSDGVAESLQRAGVRPQRIRTIDNGIDLSPFQTARPTLREELPQRSGPLVGFVGRLTRPKGGEYLLHAARQVLREVTDARFVLVGEGPERRALGELAERLEIASQVIFAGHRKDMPGVYASLDVMVLPSLNEGLPMTILEAMATGIPVVATAVGAVPRLIVPAETGLLFQPRDIVALTAALTRLLKNPTLRAKLGRNARTWVAQRFSSAAMAEHYLELYQELLPHRVRDAVRAAV